MRWGKWGLIAVVLGGLAVGGMLLMQQRRDDQTPPDAKGKDDSNEFGLKPLPAELSPGLLAEYRSLKPSDDHAALTRIDAKPAFNVGHLEPASAAAGRLSA